MDTFLYIIVKYIVINFLSEVWKNGQQSICIFLQNSQFILFALILSFFSVKVFKWLNPRLIVSGHTHHGCHRIHDNGVPEWTVASFSWRNKKGPSFLLVCLLNEFILGFSFAEYYVYYHFQKQSLGSKRKS